MLSVTMLNAAYKPFILSVIMLSVIMLSVIILNVFMLSVVAPLVGRVLKGMLHSPCLQIFWPTQKCVC
jgi:hypothetical protein